MDSTIKAEIVFLVYGHNGSGRIENKIMELSLKDYTVCSNSNRNSNEQLKKWSKMIFPFEKEVIILTIKDLTG